MADELYRSLQQRLDMYSLGFPETESGIEIMILKKLFSHEDAEMFLKLSPKIEEPESIAVRIGMQVEEVSRRLEDMARRGLLFRLKKGEGARYGAIPFMHGLYEFHVKELDSELATMVEQYFKEGFNNAIAGVNGLFIRTVPVGKSITVTPQVASYDDARAILEKNETIVVTDCICRKTKKTQDMGCGKPMEACFMFGSMAKYYLDNGLGRQVDFIEAVSILEKAQEAGIVTQPGTALNPAGMCNCCGDCCGVLGAIKKFPKPADMVFSNYQAAIKPENCTGCEACLERCQMEAISMTPDGTAGVNLDRCIGCGLCVTACPAEAVVLAAKPAAQRKVPPATSGEQMMMIAKNRGVI